MNGSKQTTSKEIIKRVLSNSKLIPYGQNYYASKFGSIYRYHSGILKKLRAYKKPNGHLQLSLQVEGESKNFLVHRLIMIAFHGESDLVVIHLNSTRDDNNLENLKYVTKQEAILHYDLGKRSKLTTDKVKEIKSKRQEGLSYRKLACEFGISHTQIKRICVGENWKNV